MKETGLRNRCLLIDVTTENEEACVIEEYVHIVLSVNVVVAVSSFLRFYKIPSPIQKGWVGLLH